MLLAEHRMRVLLFAGLVAAATVAAVAQPASPAGAANYTSVDGGAQFTCAVTSSNGAQCWGANELGQLADGTVPDHLAPVNVLGLTNVTAVVAGGYHSCALLSGGTLKCWGWNEYGQVGNGRVNPYPGSQFGPTDVCASGSSGTCSPLTGVVAVALGFYHTCAVLTSGAVRCWGQNVSGQLGNGAATYNANPNPVAVSGLTSGVVGIAAGRLHTCALTTAGGVKCWGGNEYGQVGDGTYSAPRLTPVDVSGLSSGAATLRAAELHSCVVMSSGGSVKCWGNNEAGQLGNGTTADANTPTDVCETGAAPNCGQLTGMTAVAAGDGHTCALTVDGGVRCWGWDGFGQLGDGAPDYGVVTNPTPGIYVLGLSGSGSDPDVAKLEAGSGHTCALTVAGVVKCWGWNSNGQLGNGLPGDVSSLLDADFDGDGCQDERELGAAAPLGGLRNPKSYWDFYDVWTQPDPVNQPNQWVRDKVITATGDILQVAQRFGANDAGWGAPINRYSDPLAGSPPAAPAYHPAFDRGPLVGPNPWNMGPADGTISVVVDVLGVARQFGHSCL